MTTVLDLVAHLGRVTWALVWVPVLIWTVFAVPVWAILRQTSRVHPYAEYRIWQVVLVTLPVGLLGAWILPPFGSSSAISAGSEWSVIVAPAVEPMIRSSSSSGLALTWMHAVGAVTIGAGTASLIGVGHLLLDVFALIHVRTRTVQRPLADPVQPLAEQLADTVGVDRSVQVRVSSDVIVPVTIGGWDPLILLPPNLTDHPNALRLTLRHECIHLRWYDDLAHLAERLLVATFFAHPLVHQVAGQIASSRECACDASVLADENTSASDYARLLAAFADASSPKRLGALPLSETPSSLQSRLRTMRSSLHQWLSNSFSLGTALLTLGLAVTVGVVACSDGMTPSPDGDATEPLEASAEANGSDDVYIEAEEQPDCGGLEAIRDAVQYPEFARKAGIEGRVVVQFLVTEEGTVANPEITHGVHKLLDEAALTAINTLECTPGMQDGEPVKVKMALPITFKLPSDSTASPTSTSAQTDDTPTVGLDRIVFHDTNPHENDRVPSGPVFSAQTRKTLHNTISYPTLLKKAGIDGTVEVTFVLSQSGDAQDPEITKGAHQALEARALKTVQNTRFEVMDDRMLDLSGETISVQFKYEHPGTSS